MAATRKRKRASTGKRARKPNADRAAAGRNDAPEMETLQPVASLSPERLARLRELLRSASRVSSTPAASRPWASATSARTTGW